MVVIVRQVVWIILTLFTLSFWMNVSMLIEWSSLADNINVEVNKCDQQMNFCRHRYPLLLDSTDPPVDGFLKGPDWNITAVDDDIDSFGKCRCDVNCVHYGDCCEDAADVYGSEPRGSLSSPWTCLPMATEMDRYTSDAKYYMYMIGSCPMVSINKDQSVVTMCRRQRDPESDYGHFSYLMDVPVLSLITNRTYANIYCAQCHSDASRLAPWNISIHCNDDFDHFNVTRDQMFQDDNYQPGSRNWILRREYVTFNCVFTIDEFKQPASYLQATAGRHCVPVTGDCLSNWQDTAEGNHCDVYTHYMETSAVEVPKNPHCSDRILHSFSIVMDFKFGGIRVNNKRECRSNEIFDRLHNICHAITCDTFLSKQTAGICSPYKKKNASILPLNFQCSKMTLIKDVHYYSLGNGTLVLNGTGETLQPSDYELGQNGIIQICENESFGRFLNEIKNYLKYSYAQRYLSNVCLTISVICLAFHIGIHIALPKLRNVPGKNLLSLSCTLFLGQLLFLTSVGARNSIGYGPCAAIAVLIHWSLMAAFFWMNIMGFDMCRTFAGSQIKPYLQYRASVQRRRTTFRSYSLYAWSCPSLIVTLAVVLDFTDMTDGGWAPHYGTHQCWICNKNGLGLFFVLPMAVLLAVNLMFFVLTAWSIVRQWRETRFAMRQSRTCQRPNAIGSNFFDSLKLADIIDHRNRRSYISRLRNRFILYVKLGTIMGLGWVSGLVAAMADVPALWYPFILFNTLQGTFIFLAFDCKRKVYYMVYEVITRRPHPSNLSSSQRCSTTVSTKLHPPRRISTQTSPTIYNRQECQIQAV